MNRIFRTLWSAVTQSWQAVPETAKSAGKKSKSSAAGVMASVVLGVGLSNGANAQSPPAINQLPTGGTVVRGTATISQTATAQAAAMTVNQSSQRAVVDWNTFNVGANASVHFVQPNAQAVTLNRVNDSNPSQIFGRISANGQVFISNPSGIYFSPTSSVDVGAITATTLGISNDNFMSGNYLFERNGATGKVVNEGNITAALGGYVALLAPEVQNTGVVVARAGTVAMAAGETITLNIDGAGSLAGITTTPSAIASLIENKLAVQAPDGQIILSAVALNKLQMGLIKNSGTLEANSLVNKGGKIVLEGDEIVMDRNSRIEAKGPTGGGTVLVGGDWQGSGDVRQATKVTMEAGATIDASATDNGDGGKVVLWSDIHNANSVTQANGNIKAEAGPNRGKGGQVETSGHTLKVGDSTRVSTRSMQSVAGQWLIDPNDFTVAATGGDITGATLSLNLGAGNVTIASTSGGTLSTTGGSIFVNDTVSFNANTLTLNAQNNVTVNKAMALTSTAGLSVLYGQQTASATGNTALFKVNAPIDIATTGNFSTKLGNGAGSVTTNYTIVNSLGVAGDATTAPASASLQGMAKNLTTSFVLGSDINASSTATWNTNAGFTPIGNSTTAFSGKFNGLGHTISGLTIAASATDYLGLFGKTTGSISNIILSTPSITGQNYIGGLAGYGADFYNVRILGGTITGTKYVGGMAGYATGSADTVTTNAAVNGQDSATSAAQYVGGMLGVGVGAINNITGSGDVTVTNTNTARVTGTGANIINSVGGLVGQLAATTSMTLDNNINTGNVSVTTATATGSTGLIQEVGGLIGTLGGGATNTVGNWRVTLSNSSTSGNVSVASTTAASMSAYTTYIAQGTGGVIGRVDVAGTAGRAFGGGLTLTNVSSSGNVSGYNLVGGVLGASQLNSSSAGSNVFTNLSASGAITGFGGIAALTYDTTYAITNPPTISSSYYGVGGLIGANYGGYVAQIRSSHFDGGTVKSNGGTHIGGLVGTNTGFIVDSYATGSIDLLSSPFSSSTGVVGGLVGYLGGTGLVQTDAGISGSSYSNVAITVGSAAAPIYASYIGGLVGYVDAAAGKSSTISGAHASGNITVYGKTTVVTNNNKVGGLVGATVRPAAITGTADVAADVLTVSGSMLTGTTATNYLSVGTPVGGPGILPGTYIKALLTGTGGAGTYQLNQSQTTGAGLTITAYPRVYIDNSYATGNVTASNSYYVGGLAGMATAIYNSYSSGNVNGNSAVGGLAGQGQAVYNSYALGNVVGNSTTGSTNYAVGGLVGTMVNTWVDGISRSYWAGQTVTGNQYVGGLVGWSSAPISLGVYHLIDNSYVTGSGQVQGNSAVGGLAGLFYGNITNSFNTVPVNGLTTASSSLGGLVGYWGYISYPATLPLISNSWSSGNVTGGVFVGGVVGSGAGTVLNSYATGDVTGTASATRAGGLIGANYWGGSVINSFATGAVTSNDTSITSGTTSYLGGLIGYNTANGSVNNSFATGNVTLNGLGIAGGLIGYSAVPSVPTSATSSTAASSTTNTVSLSGSYSPIGVVGVGAIVTGTGVPAGTYVTGQSTTNSNVFTLNQAVNVAASTTLTFTNAPTSSSASVAGNTLTLGGTVTGYFAPGTTIKGAGIPAGTYITGVVSLSTQPADVLVSGFGGANSTYTLNNTLSTSVSNVAITGTNTAQVTSMGKVLQGGLLTFSQMYGGFAVGMVVTGPGIPANTTITGYETRYIGGTAYSGYTLSNTGFTISTPISVVGQTLNPTISNVYATGNVVSNAAYTASFYSYLGGLVGESASGVVSSIANGYYSGSLSLTTKVSAAVTNSNTVNLVQSGAGNLLTVGTVVSGTGVPDGTTVAQFVSGTSGGTGTYRLSNNVTLAANQYLSFSSPTMGQVLRGGVIGYVGTGSNSVNTNANITSGAVVVPGLSALYFNTTANSGYYAVGNDGVSNNSLGTGATGLSATDLRDYTKMPGLNFTTSILGSSARGVSSAGNYWVLVDADGTFNNAGGATGATYPMLASEYNLKVSSTHQLQLMGLDATASYVQQNSLRFTTTDVWGSLGFVPVGTATTPFSGQFIGSALPSGSQLICPSYAGGCTISNLAINSNWTNPVGLFGTVSGAGAISGVRLLNATVSGAGTVGAVVGANAGNLIFSSSSGSISSSNTTSTTYGVGGIAGENTGTIDRVFSTATVTGNGTGATNMLVGGVVGDNHGGTLSNTYAAGTGTLRSGGFAGGIAGANSGTLSNSYAAEPVYGASTVSGGLVGNNASGTLSNSFWDTSTTGQTAPVASNGSAGTQNGNAGMVTAQMYTLANYNSATGSNAGVNPGWNFSTIWNPPVAGALYPALRDFLIPIRVTANAVTKVYDGLSYSGTVSLSYSLPNVTLSGTAGYESDILNDLNVGSYSVTPTGLYSNQYNVSFVSGTLTITKRPLTFTSSLTTPKVYDGTKAIDPSNITISGLVNGQTLTITSVDAVSSQVSANASNYINSITLADGTGLLSNYSAPVALTHSNAPVTIKAKDLSLTGVTVSDKMYDGTTSASINLSSAVLTGVLAADNGAVSLSNTGAFVSANAGSNVGISIALTGSASSNYALPASSLTANITARPLTLNGTATASDKVYDGTTSASITLSAGSSLSGMLAADSSTVSLSNSGIFASPNVGNNISVNVALSGSASGNYVLTPPSLTANITAKALTVTGTTVASKTYDRTTTAALSGGSLVGVINGETVTLTETGTFASANVGTGIVVTASDTLGGASAGNYTLTQPTGLTANITAKALTVTGTTVASKTYDRTTTAALSGGSLVGVINGDTVTLTETGTFASANVGTGIVVTANDSINNSNYTLTQPTGLTANITAKVLTVSGTTVASKTYDGTNTANLSGGSLVGVISGDAVTLTQAGTFSQANVGTGLTVTVNDSINNSNYTLTQPTGLTADITPKALGLSIPGATRVYNGTTTITPSGAVTLLGVVGSDNVVLNAGSVTGYVDKNVGTNKTVTYSGLTIGGTAASNYTLPLNPTSNANITAAALSITGITAADKTYDGNTSATLSTTNMVTTGLIAGDALTVSVSGNFADKNAGTGKTVNLTSSFSGTDAGNYTITGQSTTTAAITKAALTVSGTAVASKTYDRTTTASLSGGSLVGVVSGDTVTLTEAGTFASANVGTGIAVTTSDTIGGAGAGNYTLTQPTGLTGDITAKALTVTGTTVANKTYDRTTTASLSGGSLTGVIAGDTVTLTQAGTFASANVGTRIVVTAVDTLGGANAGNYTLTQPTGLTANINAKALTVTGTTVANKTYDRTTSATLSGGSLNGVIAGDSVTLTEAGTFASANVGTGIAVTANDSINNSNYTLTQPTALTANITAKALTVTGTTVTSKTYSGTNTATLSGGSLNGVIAGDTVTLTEAGTFASVNAGTGIAVTASDSLAGSSASNYTLTQPTGLTGTINKANATVTASSSSGTYTGLAQSVSGFTASGLVNSETAAVLTGVSASATGTNAGTYTSTASGTATNYNLTFVDGALTINKANATVTASSRSVTYNGLAQSVSGFTATGLVNNETVAVLTGVSAGATGTNAGTYTSTASGTASNYNLTFVDGALTINKANATVTANSGTTTYNGAVQSVSGFTATGLVNNETTAVLSGVSTSGGSGTNAGSYTSVATGTAANYNLTFVNGTYTINKATLAVSMNGPTKVYDGTTNATLANGSLTLTGFVSGEGATVLQSQASYNSANVLNASTVTASLAAGNYTANTGTLLSNYVLPTTASGTGSITPARLNVTGMKTYDGLIAFDAMGLVVSGVNGETFAATGSGTMSSKNVQTNQALSSVAGLSLTGNNGALTSNYVSLATSDTQVSVTPRLVNLNAPAASKTYDSTTLYQASTADLTALSNQLVGGDRVTAVDVVYANKDAGTGKRVSLNNVTISDDNGGNNYTVTKVDVNTGVINKASLAVTVVNDARFVGLSDAVGYAGVVYTGLVGGETASVLTTGTIARRPMSGNVIENAAGQYTGVLHATGWQSGNYNISYNPGNYTIVGAYTLLVQVPTVSATYGTAATYTPTAQYLDTNLNRIVSLTPTMTGNALSVSDGAGGQADFVINAANATLSSARKVQAGGYNLQADSVVKSGNNFQNLVMTGGLTVTPKILNSNLGVQAISKVYDGSTSISNLGLNFNQPLAGVVSGDTVGLVGSGSFDDRHVATNKTVNLSLGLLGTDASNYALATPSFSTNTGSITQLASVTYTGATNGNWSDFSNWAGGAMPDRNNVAQVVVPTGKTVVYNSDQVGAIGSTLAVDGAIRFTSSNAFTLANTVSGAGDLQQRGNGMLTISGSNSNFSGNLDIGAYQATLNNAQALGTGHVVSSGGQLSVASSVTLPALQVNGAVTLDTAIKTTGDQVYNGALTFLSSGTAQASNFVSNAGSVNFISTVSAGSGSMTAQRSLVVSAPQGSVLFNDQVGRVVKNLNFSTYLSTGLLDTSPYAVVVTSPLIKLFGDVTTFESQTYAGPVRVGNNTLSPLSPQYRNATPSNGHTRLLVSIDPSITFKGTVDDADPTGKVNGLDVRAISLAAVTGNTVPTITFESSVGGTSPLASLRLAAGTQSTALNAIVTDIKVDDASRRDTYYKGDIVFKGDVTVDNVPELIAERLVVDASQTMTWSRGTQDFKLRLNSQLPTNLRLVYPGSNGGNGNSNNSSNNEDDLTQAGRQWLTAYRSHKHDNLAAANSTGDKVMSDSMDHMVADVKVGHENEPQPHAAFDAPMVAEVSGATSAPVPTASPVQEQVLHAGGAGGAFVQVREFGPQTMRAQQAFIYHLPADTFVHSNENEKVTLTASLTNDGALPRWIKFTSKDATFRGKAPKGVTSLEVKVTATDRQGKRASTRVHLMFTHGSGS